MWPQKPIGRPYKYDAIIRKLEKEVLYTPACIARFAEAEGMLPGNPTTQEEIRLAKRRIRIALGRLATHRGFQEESDGFVTLEGQAPTPGWFGWRWIECLES